MHDYGNLPLDVYIYPNASERGHEVVIAQARHDAFERHLAQCMRRQGFRYVPRPYRAEEDTNPVDSKASVQAQRDWVKEYGYGFSTIVSRDATAMDVMESKVTSTEPTIQDSNADYIASLESSARDAYRAVFGNYSTGCSAEALKFAEAARRNMSEELGRKQVEDIRERFYAALDSNEEYYAAYDHWNACMRNRGWSFSDHLAAVDDVEARLFDIANEVMALDDPLNPVQLAELQAYERELATDDFECYLSEVFLRQRRIEAEVQDTILRDLEDNS